MRAVTAVLLAILSLSAMAAPPSAQAPDVRSAEEVQSLAPAQASPDLTRESFERQLLAQEAAASRKLQESIESYHDSVLATAYFALGTVFTIALLLLGYSWWFNTRAYESDKAHLREELLAKLASVEDRVALKEQAARTAAESAISARLDAVTTKSSANELQLRKEIADLRVASEKAVADALRKVDWLFKEFRAVEEMVWVMDGVPQNALLSLAQGIEMCAEDSDENMFDILSSRFEARVSDMVKAGNVLKDATRKLIENNINANLKRRGPKARHLLDELAKVGHASVS